jgi:FkbM family methyltransferase
MADSWRLRVRRALNALLHPLGLHLVRRERAFEMDDLLRDAARRGIEIKEWIDIGASDGSWSLLARRHFPAARFMLFEPLAERQPALAALRQAHGFEIVPAAAGQTSGSVAFVVDPGLDGSGIAATNSPGTRTVRMETIDGAVAARGWSGPFGIKLDTHGHEIPILEGAAHALAAAEMLVIEAYNFQLTPDALRFHDLCGWLEARGFRCCGVADPMRRPGDGVFWQVDLAFARSENAVFDSNRYC